MILQRLSKMLPAIFILLAASYVLYAVQLKPRVLILHSYSPDTLWTKRVDRALEEEFQGKSLALKRYFMHTKRYDKQYLPKARKSAHSVIDTWKPDYLLAVDDHAQSVAKEYAVKKSYKRSNIKIIYAGVNGDPAAYGYDAAENVVGILEHRPLNLISEALRDMFDQSVNGRSIKALYLCDASTTSQLNLSQVKKYRWGDSFVFSYRVIETFEEWQKAIKTAQKNVDLIIVNGYSKLRDEEGGRVKRKEVVKWSTVHSSLPIIGFSNSFVQHGGGMSFSCSPFEQGRVAAEKTLRLIEGRSLQEVKSYHPASEEFFFYYRKGVESIKIPYLLEAFARGTGTYF